MKDTKTEHSLQVDSIVSSRDFMPAVRLFSNGEVAGVMSTAMARSVAMDIMRQAARAEADAMIWRFFSKMEYPDGAAAALMIEFRKFRMELDSEPVRTWQTDPDSGERTEP
jgi:hypothetical protein